MPAPVAKIINDDSIAYCAEEWGKYEKGRLIYSCFSLLVQVCWKLTSLEINVAFWINRPIDDLIIKDKKHTLVSRFRNNSDN